GKVFSNKSSSGSLGDEIFELPGDPNALILEASPGRYLQAYYGARLEAILVNIIERDPQGAYKTIGSAVLNRN
ncbi:hypothetical protein, partial [Lactiplantibacillus plantarum]|uniref:hypothetical protein n=1 Tax=Lactiplantibacillus plantarum TaxID=1590 RepID=UPI003853A135